MNYKTQYYKGIPLNLISRKYKNMKAKRFIINHTNQNVWIPNKHLKEDGTIKEKEEKIMRTIQIEKVLKEADYVLKDNLQLLKMFKQCFV